MSNLQNLVTSAEARYPQFVDELAEHLAGKSHPQPHPEGFCIGYVKHNDIVMNMPSKDQTSFERCSFKSLQHPGPITMHKPPKERIKWAIVGIGLAWLSFWGAVGYSIYQGLHQ